MTELSVESAAQVAGAGNLASIANGWAVGAAYSVAVGAAPLAIGLLAGAGVFYMLDALNF